ncbi:type IV pilus biogenesis protein PilM [Terriglobus tenax]|uniref:hypothetical protein n=1 Tax=Terriglobus tenax TaxID=1111115 RepID=UPI0021E04474|nr:hypothetical protein [Terriglobus tenax]
MSFLSKLSGTYQRPRLAAELRTRSVVAAAADATTEPLRAVAQAALAEGALTPSLRIPNLADRVAVASALRSALERVATQSRDVTLVIPDATARVVLLDFDVMPSKSEDADSVVRFRLKRMLPFDADTAAVSYQVMNETRGSVSVLAVAMPADLRNEYEQAVREAGYEPGAMLPSSLAAVASLDPADPKPQLLLNIDESSMTTAIVKGGVLVLYRTVEFAHMEALAAEPAPVAEDPTSALAAMQADVLLAEVEHLSQTDEIARAISVSTAYFEDTQGALPDEILVAGSWPSSELERIAVATVGDGMKLREIVRVEDLLTTPSVARNLLAGVRGALKG